MINAYLRDDITIKTITYGEWGEGLETSTVIQGRIEFRTKMVRNLQGEVVVSNALVYLPLITIGHKDKIIYNEQEYSILSIEEKKDFSSRFLLVNLA